MRSELTVGRRPFPSSCVLRAYPLFHAALINQRWLSIFLRLWAGAHIGKLDKLRFYEDLRAGTYWLTLGDVGAQRRAPRDCLLHYFRVSVGAALENFRSLAGAVPDHLDTRRTRVELGECRVEGRTFCLQLFFLTRCSTDGFSFLQVWW